MFEKEYRTISGRIKTNNSIAQDYRKKLMEFNSIIRAAAIFQEVGFQAAISAATMGTANAFMGIGFMKTAGAWIANLNRGKRAVDVAVKVGSFSAPTARAKALTGILSRVIASSLMVAIKYGINQNNSDPIAGGSGTRNIGKTIFFTVLLAWIGSPGAKVAPKSAILQVFVKQGLPVIGSVQGALAFCGLVDQGLRAYQNDPEMKEIAAQIKANRVLFDQQIEALAQMQAEGIIEWARRTEGEVVRDVVDAARRIDYKSKLPYLSQITNAPAEELENLTVGYVEYTAKTEFWLRISDCLKRLAHAVNEAKRLGK